MKTAALFKYRFWFISAIFFAGFWCSAFDHVNAAEALLRWIFGASTRAEIRVVFAIGAAIIALGALLRTWATAYLHTSVVHDRNLHSDRVVADGPYRYVRNPLYLGNFLLALGLSPLASRIGFLVIIVGHAIFFPLLIFREEAGLKANAGESYLAYCRRVPRLLFSLWPRVPPSGAKPNWIDGFTGELMMWGFAASVAVLAATFKLMWFFIVLGVSLVTYILRYERRKRSQAAAEN